MDVIASGSRGGKFSALSAVRWQRINSHKQRLLGNEEFGELSRQTLQINIICNHSSGMSTYVCVFRLTYLDSSTLDYE
jgi:hypothetical protein